MIRILSYDQGLLKPIGFPQKRPASKSLFVFFFGGVMLVGG